jgi:hypothetical protein
MTFLGAFFLCSHVFLPRKLMVAASKAKGGGTLSTKGRWACVYLYQTLKSYRGVGKELNVTHDTVKKWVLRHLATGGVEDDFTPIGKNQRKVVRTTRFLRMVKSPFFMNMPDRIEAVIAAKGARTKY